MIGSVDDQVKNCLLIIVYPLTIEVALKSLLPIVKFIEEDLS